MANDGIRNIEGVLGVATVDPTNVITSSFDAAQHMLHAAGTMMETGRDLAATGKHSGATADTMLNVIHTATKLLEATGHLILDAHAGEIVINELAEKAREEVIRRKKEEKEVVNVS